MQTSQLIENLPTNPIRFLTPLVEAREKQGVNFFKINIGQPDLKTNPLLTAELNRLANTSAYEHIAYTSANGLYETREAWAQGYYEDKFKPEDVVLVNGGSEAMYLSYLCLLNQGEANLTFSPIYSNYIAFAKTTRRKIYSIPRKFSEGYHLPAKAEIEQFIKNHPDIKAITIISPDNPTGAVLTKKEVHLIFELAEKYDLWVIIDEAYRDIRFDKSMLPVSDLIYTKDQWMERAVFIATVSKEFSACGLRFGALLSKNKEVVTGIIKLVRSRLSVNEITQKISCKALNAPRSSRAKISSVYQKRRDVVIDKLQQLNIDIHPPEGALYCLPDLKEVGIKDTFKFAKWLVEEFTVKQNGKEYSVVVTPGAGFFAESKPEYNSLIRIAYVLKEDCLSQAMDILAQGIKQYTA
jgi:aspartate aminotransferase